MIRNMAHEGNMKARHKQDINARTDQIFWHSDSSHSHSLVPTAGSPVSARAFPTRAHGIRNWRAQCERLRKKGTGVLLACPFMSAASGAVAAYSCVSAPNEAG